MLGDNIEKHDIRYELTNHRENCQVFVRGFPRARTRCMQNHIWPTTRANPDYVVILEGTNFLCTSKQPEEIAERIIVLALLLKIDSFDISVSDIKAGNEQYRRKALQVKRKLKDLSKEKVCI